MVNGGKYTIHGSHGIVFVASPFISIPGLTAKELLVYFDDDGNGALSAAELATVFRFVKTEGKAVRRNEVPVLEEPNQSCICIR